MLPDAFPLLISNATKNVAVLHGKILLLKTLYKLAAGHREINLKLTRNFLPVGYLLEYLKM